MANAKVICKTQSLDTNPGLCLQGPNERFSVSLGISNWFLTSAPETNASSTLSASTHSLSHKVLSLSVLTHAGILPYDENDWVSLMIIKNKTLIAKYSIRTHLRRNVKIPLKILEINLTNFLRLLRVSYQQGDQSSQS